MPCCGGLRRATLAPAGDSRGRTPADATLSLEYVGASAISVIGPATGRGYHFAGRGSRLDVSARDAPALLAIASLRRAG